MKKHNTKEQKIMQNADNEDTCMCVYHAGKREGFNLAIKRVQEEIEDLDYPKDCLVYPAGRWSCAKIYLDDLKERLNKLQQEKTK